MTKLAFCSDWLLYGRGCLLIGQLSNIALVTLNMCNAYCHMDATQEDPISNAGPGSKKGRRRDHHQEREPLPGIRRKQRRQLQLQLAAPDNPDQSTLSFSDGDVRDCLDEWVRALASDDLQMLSLLLFEFVRRERSATVMNGRCSCVKGRAQRREDHCC